MAAWDDFERSTAKLREDIKALIEERGAYERQVAELEEILRGACHPDDPCSRNCCSERLRKAAFAKEST
jgi:hypothetical protein